MAKKRKTRRMKQKSDLRQIHELRSDKKVSPSPSPKQASDAPNFTFNPQTNTPSAVSTAAYSYLRPDLLKTLSLTGAVVLAQIVLYFLLQI